MSTPALPAWWPQCPICGGPIACIETTVKPDSDDALIRWICHGKQDWVIVPVQRAGNGEVLASGFRERAA